MRVLVTGATGFIGNHVVNYLISEGHDVIAMSTNEEKASKYAWFSKVVFKEYNYYSSPSRSLYAELGSPDVMIHLAWNYLSDFRSNDHIDIELPAQWNFLSSYIESGGKHVLVTGTCLEYGKVEGCLDEEMGTNPTINYPIAKDTLRSKLESLQEEENFILQWVRLFYMYGEGQNPKSLIPLLEKAIVENVEIFNMSEGSQLRDYLEVKTIAKYISKIALQTKVNGVINCSSGQPISVKSLVERIVMQRESKIKLNLGYYKIPEYEAYKFWGNNNKLKYIINE